MWQTYIVAIIIALAIFFIGKKVYRMIRQAIDPKQNVSCSCGCSGCSVTHCDIKK